MLFAFVLVALSVTVGSAGPRAFQVGARFSF